MINLSFIFNCSRDIAMATKFCGGIGENSPLLLNLSYEYSTMNWKIKTLKGTFTAAIIQLYRIEMWWALVQWPWRLHCSYVYLLCTSIWQHYWCHNIYLRIYWINLPRICRNGRRRWAINMPFVFAIAQGRYYGNVNFFGRGLGKLAYPTFSLCSGIPQRIETLQRGYVR